MNIIVCVDDNYGMMFNNRRQSQDRVLREHILSLSSRSRLWINHYTEKQFSQDSNSAEHLNVDDDFLDKAAPGEYCFVEDAPVASYESNTEKIILFKWNRKYPGDFHFDIDLSGKGWKLTSSEDFPGFSHEKITMEVYER